MVSLAAGLPLEWPASIETMFESFSVMSSAGSTLLVPDCELSHLPAAEAFYLKQTLYAFLPIIIMFICFTVWTMIWITCGKCGGAKQIKHGGHHHKNRRFTTANVKDYAILSVVLVLFLAYPTQVRLALSMVKCVPIGDKSYLMADLEETCFEGTHAKHTLLLFVPQLLLYVIGLPFAALMIILRNNHHIQHDQTEDSPRAAMSFRMRYGLLYMGYAKNRAWWEVVVAFRKVLIVMISSFGSLSGGVELQAYVAILLVFASIMVHLVGKPFTAGKEVASSPAQLVLHNLECVALCVCWCTFWGGLVFFLGTKNRTALPPVMLEIMSVVLIVANVIFLLYSLYVFYKAYMQDQHIIKVRRETKRLSLQGLTKKLTQVKSLTMVAPEAAHVRVRGQDAMPATDEHDDHHAHVDAIVKDYHAHELHLARQHSTRRRKSARATQLRLAARMEVKQRKVMSKVAAFSSLDADAISKIVDVMQDADYAAGDILCREKDTADKLFVIVRGTCHVTLEALGGQRIATLGTGDIFGESALAEEATKRFRGATVTSGGLEESPQSPTTVLELIRTDFDALVASGVLDVGVRKRVASVQQDRNTANQKLLMQDASKERNDAGGEERKGADGSETSSHVAQPETNK